MKKNGAMKKRALAFLTMLVLLSCALTVGAAADTPVNRYQVGYAIRDINPYIYSDALGMGVAGLGELAMDADWTVEVTVQNPATGATTKERMVSVPMSGYANSSERPSGGIMDDNGDGYTGIGDGLHITCTTVTDAAGVTLVYLSIDAISGYANVLNDVASGVTTALNGAVRTDHVFLSGSHTHEGADLGTVKKTITAASSNCDRLWRAYYDYVVARMVEAAVECYNNRTEAVMTKGSIDASVSSGYQLNYVRQYKVDEYNGYGNGIYSARPKNTYVYGANFGGSHVAPSITETLKRTVTNVSEADDMMHILQFAPTNGDKPIVLVNWRSHATMMSTYAGGGVGAIISSDYIGAFRYEMEKAGYRMSFIQGAAGNVVSNSFLSKITQTGVSPKGYTPWVDDISPWTNHVVYYGGKLLTGVALDCLKNKMSDELQPGAIRSIRTNLHLEMQKDPEGLIAAATYYQNAGLTSSSYKYTHTDGKVYILNSKHHARNVVGRAAGNPNTYANMIINALTLGESVAFVTAPTEMFDRYSLDATLTDTTDNDWDDLVKADGYGTPFVMAYTNGHNGYTANKLSYSFNEGSTKYGVGSYEANTSRNAAGEGEKIIAEYKKLLNVLTDEHKNFYCEQCKKEVQWEPLSAGSFSTNYVLSSGHYYLYEDVPLPATARNYGTISGKTVCLDLNGKTLRTNGRAFAVNSKAVLSIMDSASGGAIESYDAENSTGGGLINCNGSSVVNLYGGTLRQISGEKVYVTKGGVVAISGATMNIYGGVVDASQCALAKDPGNTVSGNTDGCGAAIALYPDSTLNISGGQIIAGKAEPEEGRADCVLVQASTSKVNLSGDAIVDEFYFDATCPANFKIDSSFTGTTSLRFGASARVYDGVDIGNLVGNVDLSGGKVICANSGCTVTTSGTNLILQTNAAAVDEDSYDDLQSALDAANGKLVVLRKPVVDNVTVNEDAYIDLNGCSITGKVKVAAGKTLYCKDSDTDDYTVSNGKYGRLTDFEGNVAGIPEEFEFAQDGYLMIIEKGETSFHRVNLQITAMNLRASETGTYYISKFACDAMAAKYVSKFGVALSVQAVPTLENLKKDCVLSRLDGFRSGGVNTNVTGTLLKGIMKESNPETENAANAQMQIYGRAYVLLSDGSYMFGAPVNRSFREQVEEIDLTWRKLTEEQQTGLVELYYTYGNTMSAWNIPSIAAAAAAGTGK